jgi:hypothetical protein
MRAIIACCAVLIVTGPALAQGQLRMVPVPADAAVVVPPRGAATAPRMALSPDPWDRLRLQQPPPAPPAISAGATLIAPFANMLLPLAAGALLGGGVPGSGGGAGGVAPPVTAARP